MSDIERVLAKAIERHASPSHDPFGAGDCDDDCPVAILAALESSDYTLVRKGLVERAEDELPVLLADNGFWGREKDIGVAMRQFVNWLRAALESPPSENVGEP